MKYLYRIYYALFVFTIYYGAYVESIARPDEASIQYTFATFAAIVMLFTIYIDDQK